MSSFPIKLHRLSPRNVYSKAISIYTSIERYLYLHEYINHKYYSLPDFICIGAQKAGTTWLMENLNQHPNIVLPQMYPHYDIHYFDININKPFAWYCSHFKDKGLKRTGESTPAYATLPKEKLHLIRDLLPDLKIIYILRNPIERAWSHAKMTLIAKHQTSLLDIDESEFVKHFCSQRSKERCDYLGTIGKYNEVFDAEQIFLGFFDDITSNPVNLLSSVFKHIGLEQDIKLDNNLLTNRVNKGVTMEIPEKYRLFLQNQYKGQIAKLAELLGGPTLLWLKELD